MGALTVFCSSGLVEMGNFKARHNTKGKQQSNVNVEPLH